MSSSGRINNIDRSWQQVIQKISGARTDMQNRVRIDREIIPVILVPGIMGSRLKDTNGVTVWDPDSHGFMLKNYGLFTRTAKKKKRMLIGRGGFKPDYLSVIGKDADQVRKYFRRYPKAEERGWTGVMWGSYGSIILALEHTLWPEPVGLCFEFPVHAFGFNWSASAEEAGKKLGAYIIKTINDNKSGKSSPDGKPRQCKYVIIVTHSMGGLVARSACKLLAEAGEDTVLGVIHGVQPALGSGAAYWRMKAGFERPRSGPGKSAWYDWRTNTKNMFRHTIANTIGAWVLGTNGEEVTALLGNMPGGLQLLPNKLYTDNNGKKDWLQYPKPDGNILTLPKANPYAEIYLLQDVPYRMVNPLWLDPGGCKATKIPKQKSPWRLYQGYLRQAEQFHDRLGLYVHPNTCQFYSSGLASPDRIVYSRRNLLENFRKGMQQSYPICFSNYGSYQVYLDEKDMMLSDYRGASSVITLEPPNGSGDGTVPDSSATALPVRKGQTVRILYENSKEWFENGHQGIYGTEKARNIVMNGIRNLAVKRIVQEVGPHKWKAINTDEQPIYA
jgi:hypothetical protein